jgi:AraC-like DNA-binding protein
VAFFQPYGMEDTPLFSPFELTGMDYPAHFHRAYELQYVSAGTLTTTIDQQTYTVQPGHWVWIFPGQIHELSIPPTARVTIVLFSPVYIADFDRHFQFQLPAQPIIAGPAPDRDLTRNPYGIKGFLYTQCANLVDQSPFIERHVPEPSDIGYQLFEYINQQYTNPECSLKTIAAKLGYDYPYLSRVFHQLVQRSFPDFLNDLRIALAKTFLQTEAWPMDTVALRSGYANTRSFNRNFHQRTGQTPSEYVALVQSWRASAPS